MYNGKYFQIEGLAKELTDPEKFDSITFEVYEFFKLPIHLRYFLAICNASSKKGAKPLSSRHARDPLNYQLPHPSSALYTLSTHCELVDITFLRLGTWWLQAVLFNDFSRIFYLSMKVIHTEVCKCFAFLSLFWRYAGIVKESIWSLFVMQVLHVPSLNNRILICFVWCDLFFFKT